MTSRKNSRGSLSTVLVPLIIGMGVGLVLLVVVVSLPWSSSPLSNVAQATNDVGEERNSAFVAQAVRTPTPVMLTPTPEEVVEEFYSTSKPTVDKSRLVALLTHKSIYFDNSFVYLQDDEGVVIYDYKGGALAPLFPIQMFYLGEGNINQYIQTAGVADVVNVNLAASIILVDNCGRPSADNVSVLTRFGNALKNSQDVKQAAAVYKTGSLVSADDSTWDASVKVFANAVAAIYTDASNGIPRSDYLTDWSWHEGYDVCKTAIAEMGGDQHVATAMMARSTVVNQKPPDACTPGVPYLSWPNADRQITQWFGAGHGAIDIATSSTLRSPVNGIVINIIRPGNETYFGEYSDSGGKVIIRPFGDDYADVQVEQWHMDVTSFMVNVGDQVQVGQALGNPGLQNHDVGAPSYGGTYWTGPHDHFALKKAGVWVDPMPCMQ